MKITDELRAITRRQAGMEGGEPGPASRGEAAALSARGKWLVALVLVVVAGGGWWLVRTLQADAKLQDCVMSGRKNCAPAGTEGP